MNARLAVVKWGGTEMVAHVEITTERWVIAPRGLLYAAGLRGSAHGSSHRYCRERVCERIDEHPGGLP